MTFKVQKRMCATCIYRPECTLNLKALEEEVKDVYGFFEGHRVCHHTPNSSAVCCRGFWEAHKGEFPAGQIAQRLDMVEFVDVNIRKDK